MHSESTAVPSATAGNADRRRRGTIPVIVQFLLILILGVAVLGALAYDSRLYYGIDATDGPIHEENVRRPPRPRITPAPAESAITPNESQAESDTARARDPERSQGTDSPLSKSGPTND